MSEGIVKIDLIGDGVSNDSYVIGAEWVLCRTKSEAAKRMRSGALSLAVADDDGQVVSAVDKEFLASKPGGRRAYLSAIALIGAAERNAVVLHELPGGLAWVAAVREGVPLPDCDRVTTLEQAHDLLSEYMGYVPSAVLIGNSTDAARSAETVFKSVDAKRRAACTYTKPKSPAVLLLKIAVVLAVLVAAGVAVQTIQVAREAADRARDAAMAKLNESARIDAAIAQYNDDVRKVVEHARAEIAISAPVQAQLALWLEQIRKQPLVQKGFRLESASCAPEACKYKWRALPRADLTGPAGTAASAIEQRDDTSLVVMEPVAEAAKQARVKEERLDLASRFHQRAGMPNVSFDVSPQLTPILVPTPAKPNVPPEMQAKLVGIQPVTVGHQAVVTLAAPLSLIRETADVMGNSVTLKGLETGPLTSATGGAVAPQIKLTGSYVRLP